MDNLVYNTKIQGEIRIPDATAKYTKTPKDLIDRYKELLRRQLMGELEAHIIEGLKHVVVLETSIHEDYNSYDLMLKGKLNVEIHVPEGGINNGL